MSLAYKVKYLIMFEWPVMFYIAFLLQAIVNEDTQGNVVSLQAEIRRLKETVQQLHSAMTPAALGEILMNASS